MKVNLKNIGGLVLAGLLTITGVGRGQQAARTSDLFSRINLYGTTLQPEPLSLNVADVSAIRWLSDTQLTALMGALNATPTIAVDALPRHGLSGNFFSLQHPDWPPLPFDSSGSPVWQMNDFYLLSDLDFNYDAPIRSRTGMRTMDVSGPPGFGDLGDGTNTYTPLVSNYTIDTNGLWLEITSVDTTNQLANLLLHNTSETNYYQLLSKTNLLQPDWLLGTYKLGGDSGTNQTAFDYESITDNPMMFFRAQQADWIIEVGANQDGIEPQGNMPGQEGIVYLFGVCSGSTTNDLKVYYRLSGTASNGVDYTTLSGVATITNSDPSRTTYIHVHPLADNLVEGTETITFTLAPTNNSLIYPGNDVATINLYDTTTMSITAVADAIEPDGPPGVPATVGQFTVTRVDFLRSLYTNMTVRYLISGTASNGVDYATLSGVVNFAPESQETNIDITPLKDNLPEGLETVTLTLLPTNTFVLTSSSNATVTINDSSTTVSMGANPGDAFEPDVAGGSGVSASFSVHRSDTRGIYTNLIVRYAIGGTASNGVDYTTLSGTVNFAPDMADTNIIITPLADYLIEGTETVAITLIDAATNGYFLDADTNNTAGTINIQDTISFQTVTNIGEPVGMDYYAPSNFLIVSTMETGSFLRIYTNLIVSNSVVITNVVVTNWSGITGLVNEVKLATVKNTANGFTNGEMFFGNNAVAKIGRLSADGTVSNLNFATLTNDTYIRGGLYIDQSGSFGGDLIAVTGAATTTGGGVWRIKSSGITTRLANITNTHLEGVITLTNDVQKWGPWAGKIITGAESKTPPEIYAIATTGTVATFPLNIQPEDFDLIPTNQDLYCSHEGTGADEVLKVSRSYFAPYVGDLLITQSGDGVQNGTPILNIVHWDSLASNFTVIPIPYPGGEFEHVTFAPINLPTK